VQLTEAVKECFTYSDVLRKLNFAPLGSNYRWLKKHIKRLGLDTSHLVGYKVPPHRLNIEKLVNTNSIKVLTQGIRNFLIKEGVLKEKCYGCGITSWDAPYINTSGKKLTLQIDHINGNNMDNRIENLRLLCPNCHSLTSTFCGRNINKQILDKTSCAMCGKSTERAIRCPECVIVFQNGRLITSINGYLFDEIKKLSEEVPFGELLLKFKCCDRTLLKFGQQHGVSFIRPLSTKKSKKIVDWPSDEDLKRLVWEIPTTKIGHNLGVSDKAVEKRCRKLNIAKPQRGYWEQVKSRSKNT
jgi:hypothetical protein